MACSSVTGSPPSPAVSVLIVDGNKAYQRSLAKVLSKEGYLVSYSDNLTIAVEVLRKTTFSIVLVDLFNPFQGRLELLESIIRLSGLAKVVVLTAFEEQQLLDQIISMGAFECLIKPVKRKSILTSLRRALV